MSKIIGIDLGTTNSAVAVMRSGKAEVADRVIKYPKVKVAKSKN